MMIDVFDEFAYNGPYILTIFVAIHFIISGQWPFFIVFILGFWINIYLNELLKSMIREPRPKPLDLDLAKLRDYLFIFRKQLGATDIKAHIWGMPSGHAQMGSFALMFFYLVNVPRGLDMGLIEGATLAGMCLLFMVTLYQRWETNSHSILQLLAGTIVGGLFAVVLFFGTKWWLMNFRELGAAYSDASKKSACNI
jgi:membrane-associated phospholipid phosphatase